MKKAWMQSRLGGNATLWFLRFAAGGGVPARLFSKHLPAVEQRTPRQGALSIEVVSHCWQYSRFLIYQLSSLALFPPQRTRVTMTVFYSPEDEKTEQLLRFFSSVDVPNVTWNWQPRRPQELFRRAIGRNQAALASQADWVWFTDCDLLFRDNCFDALSDLLQGRRDALVYPREERCTDLLAANDPVLKMHEPAVVDINTEEFTSRYPSRATGPLQITHGDVARAMGYCNDLSYYQLPADHWCKAHEDRAHRWLLESQGVPLDVPGVYRIRHVFKGRYTEASALSRLRSAIRQRQSTKLDKAAREARP